MRIISASALLAEGTPNGTSKLPSLLTDLVAQYKKQLSEKWKPFETVKVGY